MDINNPIMSAFNKSRKSTDKKATSEAKVKSTKWNAPLYGNEEERNDAYPNYRNLNNINMGTTDYVNSNSSPIIAVKDEISTITTVSSNEIKTKLENSSSLTEKEIIFMMANELKDIIKEKKINNSSTERLEQLCEYMINM